jgi:hypothetical protein
MLVVSEEKQTTSPFYSALVVAIFDPKGIPRSSNTSLYTKLPWPSIVHDSEDASVLELLD